MACRAPRRPREARGRPHQGGRAALERGWTAEEVAEALLIDPNTVRNHFRRCQQDGLAGLRHVAYGGSDCALDDGELAALDVHVQTKLYLTAQGSSVLG